MKQASLKKIDGSKFSVAVITARFNPEITDKLKIGCLSALEEAGVKKNNIIKIEVPGSFELPWAAQRIALNKKVNAVVCLGAVIQGETDHHKFIAAEAARGIQSASLKTGKPIILGVLTCKNKSQAIARSTDDNNKGYEAGWAAVEMASLAASN